MWSSVCLYLQTERLLAERQRRPEQISHAVKRDDKLCWGKGLVQQASWGSAERTNQVFRG